MDQLTYLAMLRRLAPGDIQRGEIALVTDEAAINAWTGPGVGAVYEDPYIAVFRDLVRFPSGALGTYLRIALQPVESNAGVLFVPRSGRDYVLIKVFRHATRRWSLEFPRGFLPIGCDLIAAARAELREEAGLRADSVVRLGSFTPDSGLHSGEIHVFEGQVSADGVAEPEETEALAPEVLRVDPETLAGWIREGRVRDGLTLAAFSLSRCQQGHP